MKVIAISGALAAAAISLAVGIGAEMGRHSAFPEASVAAETEVERGATGGLVPCAGGLQTQTFFTQDDDRFTLVGTLAEIGMQSISVETAVGEMVIDTSFEPEVEGEYRQGNVMEIEGAVEDDWFVALRVGPVCPPVSVMDIGTPAPTPTPEPTVAPPAAPTADGDAEAQGEADGRGQGGPNEARGQDDEEDDDEEDDDDYDDDRRGRGHGNRDKDRQDKDDDKDDD